MKKSRPTSLLLHSNKKSSVHNVKSVMNTRYGAVGGIFHGRTQYAAGILLPKALRRWLALLEADFKSLRINITATRKGGGYIWRSGRDLNPRGAFDANTISSRARYDHFDTTACHNSYAVFCNSTAYYSKDLLNVKEKS